MWPVSLASIEDATEIPQSWVVRIVWDRGQSWVAVLFVAATDERRFRRIGHFSPDGDLKWAENGTHRGIKNLDKRR